MARLYRTALHDAFITPDEQYEIRCLAAPEVRLDIDGVWQLERFAWFAARRERDRWLALAYTQTPSRRQAIATLIDHIETLDAAIGFLGERWSQVAAAPTAVAGLQRLCLQVMSGDLTTLLKRATIFDAEAMRDAQAVAARRCIRARKAR